MDPIAAGSAGRNPSENCLYLNVWIPAKSAREKRPVLMWLHPRAAGAAGLVVAAVREPRMPRKRPMCSKTSRLRVPGPT